MLEKGYVFLFSGKNDIPLPYRDLLKKFKATFQEIFSLLITQF